MSGGGVGHWLLMGAGAAVAVTVAAAIVVMGTPSAQRDARLDQRRVRDLQRIVETINDYVENKQSLPPDLDMLAKQPGHALSIADPNDGSPYTYQITGDKTFRLCAVFTTDTAKTPETSSARNSTEWLHSAGRQCFDRKAESKDASA